MCNTSCVKAIILLLLSSFTGIIFAQTQETVQALSFEEALQRSYENNFGLKAASLNTKAKQAEKKAAKGLFLPKVNLTGSYVMMSDPLHLDLTEVKNAITPIYSALGNYGTFSGVPNPDPATNGVMPTLPDDISTQAVRTKFSEGLTSLEAANWDVELQGENFGFVNANVTLPIYAGGKIRAANKAAKIYHDEAQNEYELEKGKVLCDLTQRYFAWVLAEEALNVRAEVLTAMELRDKNAQLLRKEGLISDAEYLHVKVFYSEAKREHKKAKRLVAIAKKACENSLGMENIEAIKPISSLFITKDLPSLENYLAKIPAQSKHLKKVDFKMDLAKTKHHVEQGEFMPNLAFMGTYQIAESQLSHLVPKYMFGLGLTWDLFDGGARLNKLRASKIQNLQVEEIKSKVNLGLETVVTKCYEELQMYIEQMQELETAERFANEYYRVREKAFSEGLATASEVSDANLAKAKVRIEQLQNKYQFDITLATMLNYLGEPESFIAYQKQNN